MQRRRAVQHAAVATVPYRQRQRLIRRTVRLWPAGLSLHRPQRGHRLCSQTTLPQPGKAQQKACQPRPRRRLALLCAAAACSSSCWPACRACRNAVRPLAARAPHQRNTPRDPLRRRSRAGWERQKLRRLRRIMFSSSKAPAGSMAAAAQQAASSRAAPRAVQALVPAALRRGVAPAATKATSWTPSLLRCRRCAPAACLSRRQSSSSSRRKGRWPQHSSEVRSVADPMRLSDRTAGVARSETNWLSKLTLVASMPSDTYLV